MTTTQSRFGKFSILVFLAILAISATVSFAHPKDDSSTDAIRSLRLVGTVASINSDHTFDFVSTSGQKYRVHMSKDAMINTYQGFRYQKSLLSFEDLYKGARVTFIADSISQTDPASPMPVAVR